MEQNQVVEFLKRPNLGKLPYIQASKNIYVNLFDIKFTKKVTVFKYPYHVDPELGEDDMSIREKIFKYLLSKLRPVYKECFHSGDMLYSLEKVTEVKHFDVTVYYNKHEKQYHVTIQPFSNEVPIDPNVIGENGQIAKQCIELMLKDILHANPNLEFYKKVIDCNQ